MKPFLVFRGPESAKWNYRPQGKNKYRVNMWVQRPFHQDKDVNDFRIKQPITLAELKPIMDIHANEMMDLAQADLYEHWAKFLIAVNDSTSEEEIDHFHDNFPTLKYGYECYVWG